MLNDAWVCQRMDTNNSTELIIRSVCFFVLGVVLLLTNVPIFLLVTFNRNLLKRYAVLWTVFLGCVLTGKPRLFGLFLIWHDFSGFLMLKQLIGMSSAPCLLTLLKCRKIFRNSSVLEMHKKLRTNWSRKKWAEEGLKKEREDLGTLEDVTVGKKCTILR